jgi:hypothetical protein
VTALPSQAFPSVSEEFVSILGKLPAKTTGRRLLRLARIFLSDQLRRLALAPGILPGEKVSHAFEP